MRSAIYPGSFDPITNGHLDIVRRASVLFDTIYVCVASNPNKSYTFDVQQRAEMIKEATKDIPNVKVISTENLIVEKAKEIGAIAIVRGLRAVTDFEFEFQLAAGNEFIDSSIEMVFLMSSLGKNFISSSNIKEYFIHDVDISPLVPSVVIDYMKERYSK